MASGLYGTLDGTGSETHAILWHLNERAEPGVGQELKAQEPHVRGGSGQVRTGQVDGTCSVRMQQPGQLRSNRHQHTFRIRYSNAASCCGLAEHSLWGLQV